MIEVNQPSCAVAAGIVLHWKMLQNAVEFSAHDVTVNIEWTAIDLHITIVDDGPGFARATLACWTTLE